MSVSVKNNIGGGDDTTIVGFRFIARQTSTQGCVSIPLDTGTAKKLVFALSVSEAPYTSVGGIYGSNDDSTYTKIVAFSNYGATWYKSGEVSGYRYYKVAYSHAGGSGTNYGYLHGAVCFPGNPENSMNISAHGGNDSGATTSKNYIYGTSNNLSASDSRTDTISVAKSSISEW